MTNDDQATREIDGKKVLRWALLVPGTCTVYCASTSEHSAISMRTVLCSTWSDMMI